MSTFVPGRLPNDPDKPRLRLSNHLDTSQVVAPLSVDNITRAGSYPMDGNDQYGDCTCAELAHHIQSVAYYGSNKAIVPTLSQVLKAYSDITGFNPDDPSTDNGAIMQDVQNYWRKIGLAGHKSLAFAEVDVKNLDEVRAAIYLFGAISVGINFPASAMNQFNKNKPWDVVTGSHIEGGHAIHVAGYDTARGVYLLTTWGKVIEMTQAFWDTYVEEAWVPLLPEWLSAQGASPTGLDLEGLGVAFSNLTGQPNPIPGPVVPPVNPPVPPAPLPGQPDEHDAEYIAAVDAWAHKHHTGANKEAANAYMAWKKAKGF